MRLKMAKYSFRLMSFIFLLVLTTGCSSTSTELVDVSPLDDISLELTSGTCEYHNGDESKTYCLLKVLLKNNGQEPISINGKFRFSISTRDYQVRLAQYKEYENEGAKTINAPQVIGLDDGVVGVSDTRIDEEVSPLENYNFSVAVIVPTGTVINEVSVKIDKNAEYASESIWGDYLGICTYGDKSASSSFRVRGRICEKGKAVFFNDLLEGR